MEGVVRWHHEMIRENRQKVTSEEAHELIDLVIFANWAVNELKFGFSGHESPEKPTDELLKRLMLDSQLLDQVLADIENELKTTEDFCDLLEKGELSSAIPTG